MQNTCKEKHVTYANLIIINLRKDDLVHPVITDTIWKYCGEKISTGVWMGVCQGEIGISFMVVIPLQWQYCHPLSMSFRNSIVIALSLFVFRSSASSKEEMVEYYHNHKLYEFLLPIRKDNFWNHRPIAGSTVVQRENRWLTQRQ